MGWMLLRRARVSRTSRVVCPADIVLVVSLLASATAAKPPWCALVCRRRRCRRRAGSVSLRERTEERARTRRVGEENCGTRSVVSRTPHRHHPTTLRDNPARGRDPPCDNCVYMRDLADRVSSAWSLLRRGELANNLAVSSPELKRSVTNGAL